LTFCFRSISGQIIKELYFTLTAGLLLGHYLLLDYYYYYYFYFYNAVRLRNHKRSGGASFL